MNTQNFSNFLENRLAQCGNPICMGMDPVLELIPLEGNPEEKIKRFYFEILEEVKVDSNYKDIPVIILSNLGQK